MILQYNGYNKLLADDICIAMCYFNPLKYHKPLENIQIIQKEFDKYSIPYYTVELIYPNQYPVIKNAHVVRSNSVLFSKENLWNIAEKIIPSKFTKIIFMDSDIVCSDSNWINNTRKLLETNYLVHNMDYSYRDIDSITEQKDIDINALKYSFIKAIKNNEQIELLIHHTGYCTAIDREFFHKLGGIFDHGITGHGDTLFWASFIDNYDPPSDCQKFLMGPRCSLIRKNWNEYKKNALSVSSLNKISYLPDANILHLKHGAKENRKYGQRSAYISGVFNLFYNDDGVLEINIINENNKDLIQYWIDRKEDE